MTQRRRTQLTVERRFPGPQSESDGRDGFAVTVPYTCLSRFIPCHLLLMALL